MIRCWAKNGRNFACRITTMAFGSFVAICLLAHAAETASTKRRAPRPRRWPKEIAEAFSPNVRAELGPGPAPWEQAPRPISDDAAPPEDLQTPTAETPAWASVITAEVIEDEIKAQVIELDAPLANAGAFKSGGAEKCREILGLVAVLFDALARHPDSARWKPIAPQVARRAARAAANCRAASDGSFAYARQTTDFLRDLVRGQSPDIGDDAAESDDAWRDRPALMKRLELADQERLGPWTADESQWKRHLSEIRHEAQVTALVAAQIVLPGYDSADDESYRGFATSMFESAVAIDAAAGSRSLAAAQLAQGILRKSCSGCHGEYRD